MALRLIEQDADVVEAEAEVPEGRIVVVARIKVVGDEIVLYNLHIDGPGTGTLGSVALRRLVDEVLERYDVESVTIHGFRRTTGATPGRIPAPLRFRRRRGPS